MQLLKTLLLLKLWSVCAIGDEVCIDETFNATCPFDNLIVIQSALYGRMRSSRCTDFNITELGCSANVSRLCNRRNECTIKASDDTLRQADSSCSKLLKPYLEVFYTCVHANSNEVCIDETFKATCPTGTFIFIESALYGRMRSNRCIDFDNNDLNCFENVQPLFESLCNRSVECSIKASNETLKNSESSCSKHLKPYLEVFYACVGLPEFICPPFNLPLSATKQRMNDGYNVSCDHKSSKTIRCTDGKWDSDPGTLCPRYGVTELLIFINAVGVFMLIAIISVAICLKRIQKSSNRRKSSVARRQNTVGESDYPESHMRRPRLNCDSESEYEYQYKYDVQQDDGPNESYSYVRKAGP